jgi:iron complex transport system substrate-binding protein
MMTLLDARHMLVLAKLPVPGGARRFGIRNAWRRRMTFWGVRRRYRSAGGVSRCRCALFRPRQRAGMQTDGDAALAGDAVCARGRFQRVPAVWFYGATLSAMHFARVLDNALGGKA